MSEKYTKGPWQLSAPEDRYDTWLILCSAPHEVAHIAPRFKSGERDKEQEEANARRIVACVNACEGISTESLEDNRPVKWLAQQYNEVIKQRDELLEALKDIAGYWNRDQNETAMADACWHAIQVADEAIAKATGEQA